MDVPFFIILMTIVTIGLIMLFSASYTYSYYFRTSSTELFTKQLIYGAIGILGMLLVSRIRYEYFKVFSFVVAGVSVLLLIVVRLLPDSVQPGFYPWIDLGFITFQPSEIAKLGLILFLAFCLEQHHKGVVGKVPSDLGICRFVEDTTNGKYVIYKSFTSTIAYGFFILLFAVLVLIENHVSGAVLMLAIGVIMLFLGEVKNKWFIVGVVVALIAGTFGILIGYAVSKNRRGKLSNFVSSLAFLPYLIPALSFGAVFFALISTPAFNKLNVASTNQQWSAIVICIIAGSIKFLPFASRSGTNAMLQLSGEIEEAAIITGCP
jgi:cell division protein FtsW (lipid II flippase)